MLLTLTLAFAKATLTEQWCFAPLESSVRSLRLTPKNYDASVAAEGGLSVLEKPEALQG